MLVVAIEFQGFPVLVAVHGQVGEEEVAVTLVEQAGPERVEDSLLVDIEEAAADQFDHRLDSVVLVDPFPRVIGAGQGCDFLLGMSENEHVLPACRFGHLDVRPVQGSHRQGSVDHELHVACAAGFGSRGGNLLADVAGGNDVLCQGDAVVGQEEDLQLVTGLRIGVDHLGDVVDELDDQFGVHIAGSALACEEEGGRRHALGHLAMVLQVVVQQHDMQDVEQLALVFVDPLDLRVEEHARVDDVAAILADASCGIGLGLLLDFGELLQEGGLFGEWLQKPDLAEVGDPAIADGAGD